ncbi:MAG: AAA family ATPase [Oligoflexia bacterium]|nr:AAA family ATPase [Oligoflexia bacterium]
MVFIGGPRQVGKTTLAKSFLEKQQNSSTYLNWDNFQDKKIIIKKSFGYSVL